MIVLSGIEVSKVRREKLKLKVKKLKAEKGVSPGLAVILVGADPASHVYVKNKIKACEQVGITSFEHKLSTETTAESLKQLIHELNKNKEVHGILVQLPLPSHLNSDEILDEIDAKKDPDALTTLNMGLLAKGQPLVAACTPSGVMCMLEHYDISVAGMKAVVVGRSNIVGKPMAQLLQLAHATVTVCHSKTKNMREYTGQADIVVVAAGRPGFLGKDDFKKNSVVIDVGIHRKEVDGKNKLCGDVRYEELAGWVRAATPVPGGVGPMTITMLLENTFKLCEL